jgi:hypothetical protein
MAVDKEYAAYKDGYAYGVKHGFDKLVEAKADLNLYPDDQDLRIEWDRGYAHCRANVLLGHDVKLLLEHEMFWLEDEGAIVIDLKRKLEKAERLCLDCLSCCLISEMPDYSEWTPGHGMEFRCNKNKWEFDPREARKDQLKSFLETARECPDFEEN